MSDEFEGLIERTLLGPQLSGAAAARPEAVILADDMGRYLDVNPAACALTGFTREELTRMGVQDLTAAELQPHARTLWKVFQDRGELTGRYALRTKAGGSVAVSFRARTDLLSGLHVSLLTPA